MFWNALSINKKMGLLSLLGITLVASSLVVMTVVLKIITDKSSRGIEESMQTVRMLVYEVEHLQWVETMHSLLQSPIDESLLPELDPSRCSFGKWLNDSTTNTDTRYSIELQQLTMPHALLHQSARSIVTALQKGDIHRAQLIFMNQTKKDSSEVISRIHAIRVAMEKDLRTEQLKYAHTATMAWNSCLLSMGGLAVSGVVIWLLFSRSLVVPLRRIAETCSSVVQGDLNSRVDMYRSDEIGQIASTLNTMLDTVRVKVDENEARVREVMRFDQLLRSLNEVARMLLTVEDEQFHTTVHLTLELVGKAMNVDRVYIWEDRIDSDLRRYCDQRYEWTNGVGNMQKELASNVSYDDVLPRWRELFMQHKCVSGLVRHMPPSEQAQLTPQGILSILVVPIVVKDAVWGFIGYDDCTTERRWLSVEKEVLIATGDLVAAAIRRYHLNRALTAAKVQAEEATSAKSDFLSHMSHEIRTPMNAILGFTYIAQQHPMSPELSTMFAHIHTAASNLLGIINDILDFSKIEARKLELEAAPFELRAELASIFTMLQFKAGEKGIDATCAVDPHVPDMLQGDAVRLRQILLNLLGNAIKFTAKGGVRLEVVVLEHTTETATLCFTVEDTGIGIPLQECRQLFLPFMQADASITRRYGGTGLGLVICKELAELMQGTITVESWPGQGSLFTCTLPFTLLAPNPRMPRRDLPDSAHEAGEQENDEPTALAKLSGAQILLVEDNEINRLIARAILEAGGIFVSEASNGEEAVEAVKNNPYDLVLMDVQMPVMDGLEATRRIRTMPEVAPNLPIVAMTAHAMNSDYAKSLEAGMTAHITKPIDPELLMATLARLLH